jgi:hypothetical protein
MSPRLAGLPSAEGGFETALGWFGASWSVTTRGTTTTMTVKLDVPEGTSGSFEIPDELQSAGRGVSVTVDGKRVVVATSGVIPLAGGNHTVVAVARD